MFRNSIVTSGGPIFNKDNFGDPVAIEKTNRLVQYGAWIDTRAHVNEILPDFGRFENAAKINGTYLYTIK